MATYVVEARAAGAVLLTRFEALSSERRARFIVLHRKAIDQLLRTRGTAELRNVMPVNTGALQRSVRLYLRGDSVRIRIAFYGFLNRRARAMLRDWAQYGLPALIRDAANMAAAALT